MKYAEVIAPLPLDNTFTYLIPAAWEDIVMPYCLVEASFGKNRWFTGLVTSISDRKPDTDFEIKELLSLLDYRPAVRPLQVELWKWIASYYICTVGEVFKAALPSGLTSEGKTMTQSYKPKTETFIRLSDSIRTEEALNLIFASLKKAPQQEQLLLAFLACHCPTLPRHCEERSNPEVVTTLAFSFSLAEKMMQPPIKKAALLQQKGATASALNALIKKGILVAEEQPTSRIFTSADSLQPKATLTPPQQKAYTEIKQSFENKNITLLHGVTSSGKTEIYIHLIADALKEGKQALYLLPEMAVTTQITERLKRIFGNKLMIYHSGCSDNEQVEVWLHLLQSDEPAVVLGMRSAVFLPFAKLGLVIVDEEQEPSYKQQDPAPRYHARNVAMALAKMHGAKTLLGSAAPSLESYLWAYQGVYGFVRLQNRYGDAAMPQVEIADIRDLRRKRRMRDTLFSPALREKTETALAKGEQVILFQNRRGFAPFVICPDCGETPRCVNCDVSMTYHKQSRRLVCHYCGYSSDLPTACSKCGSREIKMTGFGTEKIEEEAAMLFPTAKIARLDIDTVKTRNAYARIIADFEQGKTQILIGTQMITKGLDFSNVTVTGILDADGMMNIPDFRAYERAFHVMLQAAGRAGRRNSTGSVVMQTSQADNPLINSILHLDYDSMASMQLKERHTFRYPPYKRLIYIILRCQDDNLLENVSEIYYEKLQILFGESVSAPVTPPISRVKTLFIRRIMLRTDLSTPISDTRRKLKQAYSEMYQLKPFRKIILHYDVDPQ